MRLDLRVEEGCRGNEAYLSQHEPYMIAEQQNECIDD